MAGKILSPDSKRGPTRTLTEFARDLNMHSTSFISIFSASPNKPKPVIHVRTRSTINMDYYSLRDLQKWWKEHNEPSN